MKHRAEHPEVGDFCGFYWHSTRLARKGTDYIYNEAKPGFQGRATDNKITWDDCKELLFNFKKTMDQHYRNMLWHFRRGGECQKCTYWDDVYLQHLAKVQQDQTDDSLDISDAEMLSAVEDMEANGAN